MPENVTYKGKVTMYPNITDDKSDLQYGQSAEITFSGNLYMSLQYIRYTDIFTNSNKCQYVIVLYS